MDQPTVPREAFLDFLADAIIDDDTAARVSLASIDWLSKSCGFSGINDAIKALDPENYNPEQDIKLPAILPIIVEITPSQELLVDIAITAAEGGINYWARIKTYRHENMEFPELVITYSDTNDDSGPRREVKITKELVNRGLQMVFLRNNTRQLASHQSIYNALCEQDATHIDAEGADTIIQLAVFGDITYG